MKVLNCTKLILDDYGNNLHSFPSDPSVTGQALFFSVSYSKPAQTTMFAKLCPICVVTRLQLSLLSIQKIFWYIHFHYYKIEPIFYPWIRNFITQLAICIQYGRKNSLWVWSWVIPLREMNESKRRQVTFWRKINAIGTGIILAIVEKNPPYFCNYSSSKLETVEIFIQFLHIGNFLLHNLNKSHGNYSREETIRGNTVLSSGKRSLIKNSWIGFYLFL